MNKELLLKVKEQILKEPAQFIMEAFFTSNPRSIPNCGTAACIAGWAIAIAYEKKPSETREEIHRRKLYCNNYGEVAAEILDITEKESSTLFYEDNWPTDLQHAWVQTFYSPINNSKQKRAEIAAERIDRFIVEMSGK